MPVRTSVSHQLDLLLFVFNGHLVVTLDNPIQPPTTMKHCTICRSDASSLKVLPQHGQHKHAEHERACDECWEAWISLQVEENSPSEIRCMFTKCTSMLDAAQIGKLARKGTVYR
jgi:hypothetical protein